MPNIYTNRTVHTKKIRKNVYSVSTCAKKADIEKELSSSMTKLCVKTLSEGINEFISTLSEFIVQEK